jgi:hypothetical protein
LHVEPVNAVGHFETNEDCHVILKGEPRAVMLLNVAFFAFLHAERR